MPNLALSPRFESAIVTQAPKTTTELQQEIDCLRAQLVEAQKMTALGELVGTTTHEFNNVLMTIINYAKLGLRQQDHESRDKAFNKILSAGERAAKITSQVLGMAKNRAHEFEPTCLNSIISDSLFLLEKEMQKYRIELDVNLQDIPQVRAIGNQIQQILLNLLINARQAIGEGGRIDIRTGFDVENKLVSMVVRDYGPGISQEKLRKIFEPYYSTKSGPDETGRGGTGLGLSACRDIVNAHDGKIRVESSLGKGTCFTIMLPVASTCTAPTPHFNMAPNAGPVPTGQNH